METPSRLAKSSSDITQILDEYKADKEAEIANLKVAVRVRPMNVKECSNYRVKNCIKVQDNELTVLNGPSADGLSGKTFTFHYDNVFWSCNDEDPHFADQKNVYDDLAKPLVDSAFEGYNICLFAYGQTGSGKSYSMMGIDSGKRQTSYPICILITLKFQMIRITLTWKRVSYHAFAMIFSNASTH